MQLYLQWRRIEQLVCSRDPECWPVCLGGSEKRGTEVGAVFACLFGGSLNDSRGSWALAAALPSLCMRTSTCRLAALAGSVLLASNSDSTDATSCEPFWNTYECFESVFEWIFEIHFLIFLKHCLKAAQSQLSDLWSSLWPEWLHWRLWPLWVRVWSPLSFLSFSLSFSLLSPLPFPSFLPFNSFVEIYFIHYTAHTFAVYKTMVFSVLKYMWNHHQSILELFISRRSLYP